MSARCSSTTHRPNAPLVMTCLGGRGGADDIQRAKISMAVGSSMAHHVILRAQRGGAENRSCSQTYLILIHSDQTLSARQSQLLQSCKQVHSSNLETWSPSAWPDEHERSKYITSSRSSTSASLELRLIPPETLFRRRSRPASRSPSPAVNDSRGASQHI